MKPILCKGYIIERIGEEPKADINISDIFSFLIKEVGKNVEHYASDLFYDLKAIEMACNSHNPKTEMFLIGLRDCGVDSKEVIKMKMSMPEVFNTDYISMYVVFVDVNDDEMEMTVSLHEVNIQGEELVVKDGDKNVKLNTLI